MQNRRKKHLLEEDLQFSSEEEFEEIPEDAEQKQWEGVQESQQDDSQQAAMAMMELGNMSFYSSQGQVTDVKGKSNNYPKVDYLNHETEPHKSFRGEHGRGSELRPVGFPSGRSAKQKYRIEQWSDNERERKRQRRKYRNESWTGTHSRNSAKWNQNGLALIIFFF